jgi:hypothetical protein
MKTRRNKKRRGGGCTKSWFDLFDKEYNKCLASEGLLNCEKPMWDVLGMSPWYKSCMYALESTQPISSIKSSYSVNSVKK